MARSSSPNEKELAELSDYVCRGDIRGAEATLRAGVDVNLLRYPSIALAAQSGNARMAECLIALGANVNQGLSADILDPQGNMVHRKGSTAMYIAVYNINVGVVRVLLRAGADINIGTDDGIVPLMRACLPSEEWAAESAAILHELLDAGADSTIATPEGMTALHCAMHSGSTHKLDILLSKAPAVIGQVVDERTSLYIAAGRGADQALRSLLLAGATQPMSLRTQRTCPLSVAALLGHTSSVRVLLDEGMEAIGGLSALIPAMYVAARNGQARALQMLLDVEGEDRREHWARCHSKGAPLICLAAANNCLPVLSVLLAAGANETATTNMGVCASVMAGVFVSHGGGGSTSSIEAATASTARTLKRASAFRARSWLWPTFSGDSTSTVVAAAADCRRGGESGAILSPREGGSKVPLGGRVFPPKNNKVFVRLVGRYARKTRGGGEAEIPRRR
ncbi:unnamed protein product [Pylaiella littoralis]